jgi:CheY-like chemotaxis protein
MLDGSKAVVQTATSVNEAMEMLAWYSPHVLISDLAMPDEDGYSLIRKVRTLGADKGYQIPAIALTSYVRVEDRTRALAAGFNMFVPKPVQPDELITAIVNLADTSYATA